MDAATERPRILVGAVLVLLGALFLLNNAGILRGFSVWDTLWGVFWLWLGTAVVGPRGRGVGATRLALGVGLIVVGVVTLADGIGLIDFSAGFLFSRFWPLILIVLGILILYESNRARVAGPPISDDRIEHDSIFGDFKLTQPGWQLRQIQASTVIGDMKIDLARAHIPGGETLIDLRAVIGDVDILAPPDLPVALDAQCVLVTVNHFGRKQDIALRRYAEVPDGFALAARRVRVRVNLVFGDVSLTHAK